MTPNVIEELGTRGASLRALPVEADGERAAELDAQADHRMAVTGPRLSEAVEPNERFAGLARHGAVSACVREPLRRRFRATMGFIDALQQFHERDGISALLLNESEMHFSKAAALWAGQARVPRFLLTHGANITRHETVSGTAHAEWILTFGDRAFGSFLDDGVDRSKLVETGNPGWDYLRNLPPPQSRSAYRAQLAQACGSRPELPTVVFATTWRAKLTAAEDTARVGDPARCFFRACKILESEGLRYNACIKGRVSNSAGEIEFLEEIARRVGSPRHAVLPAESDMVAALLASDVLVCSDSNAAIEAMLLGIPSINIWTLTSWLQGPSYGAEDGVAQVRYDQPERLAALLRSLLFDGGVRSAALARARQSIGAFNVIGERTAAERVAYLIDSVLSSKEKGDGTQQRFAWQELSSPQDERTKGTTQEYYDNPRHELIALFTHQPRRVVDVGCGGGATGAEIKRRFPSTEVIGVELNAGAAAWASKRIDRVINDNVETLEWAAHGLEPDSIDTVLFPDVLEHLRDPWNTLVRIKPFLAPDARVFASIPNVRNLWLLMQLVRGNFTYEHEGLLDVTHIRFFTLREVQRLFHETGYEVEHIGSVPDGRTAALNSSFEGTTTVRGERLTLTEMTQRDVQELKTLQFLVRAKPIA